MRSRRRCGIFLESSSLYANVSNDHATATRAAPVAIPSTTWPRAGPRQCADATVSRTEVGSPAAASVGSSTRPSVDSGDGSVEAGASVGTREKGWRSQHNRERTGLLGSGLVAGADAPLADKRLRTNVERYTVTSTRGGVLSDAPLSYEQPEIPGLLATDGALLAADSRPAAAPESARRSSRPDRCPCYWPPISRD